MRRQVFGKGLGCGCNGKANGLAEGCGVVELNYGFAHSANTLKGRLLDGDVNVRTCRGPSLVHQRPVQRGLPSDDVLLCGIARVVAHSEIYQPATGCARQQKLGMLSCARSICLPAYDYLLKHATEIFRRKLSPGGTPCRSERQAVPLWHLITIHANTIRCLADTSSITRFTIYMGFVPGMMCVQQKGNNCEHRTAF